MASYKLEIIVLRRKNIFEADKLITAFSSEKGLARFIAKGVRRTKSKNAGSLEPFCYTKTVLATGRNLGILTSTDLVKNFLGNNPDLEKIKTATFLTEVTEKISFESQPNLKLFNLLKDTLTNLDRLTPGMLKIYFLVNLFEITGVLPNLETCIKCGDKPSDDIYFSIQGGGIIDENCASFFEDSEKITKDILKLVRFARNNIKSFLKLKITSELESETLQLVMKYQRYNFDIRLKSLDI